MRYLIIVQGEPPYYTKWYTNENCWRDNCGMMVFDLMNHEYTTNGIDWKDIIEDHL